MSTSPELQLSEVSTAQMVGESSVEIVLPNENGHEEEVPLRDIYFVVNGILKDKKLRGGDVPGITPHTSELEKIEEDLVSACVDRVENPAVEGEKAVALEDAMDVVAHLSPQEHNIQLINAVREIKEMELCEGSDPAINPWATAKPEEKAKLLKESTDKLIQERSAEERQAFEKGIHVNGVTTTHNTWVPTQEQEKRRKNTSIALEGFDELLAAQYAVRETEGQDHWLVEQDIAPGQTYDYNLHTRIQEHDIFIDKEPYTLQGDEAYIVRRSLEEVVERAHDMEAKGLEMPIQMAAAEHLLKKIVSLEQVEEQKQQGTAKLELVGTSSQEAPAELKAA